MNVDMRFDPAHRNHLNTSFMSSPAEAVDFESRASMTLIVPPNPRPHLPEPIINIPQDFSPSKGVDTFREGIQMFISIAENDSCHIYLISQICRQFNFQRRRLYDVVNVLESIGCCQKKGVDTLEWLGLNNVAPTFAMLQDMMRINDPNMTLSMLFPSERCITITHLTISFVMMFFALKMCSLDMKHIAEFMARGNGRYKTTLCKLYQISHILEAAGIIGKSTTPGEMRIKSPYFQTQGIPIKVSKDEIPSLCSITSLLNRHNDIFQSVVENRQAEFFGNEMDSVNESEYSMVSSPI